MQNEAAGSDGQESSEEAELKRKKIEVQKVIVGREGMELTVLRFVSYLGKFLIFHFAINSLFIHLLQEGFFFDCTEVTMLFNCFISVILKYVVT